MDLDFTAIDNDLQKLPKSRASSLDIIDDKRTVEGKYTCSPKS